MRVDEDGKHATGLSDGYLGSGAKNEHKWTFDMIRSYYYYDLGFKLLLVMIGCCRLLANVQMCR